MCVCVCLKKMSVVFIFFAFLCTLVFGEYFSCNHENAVTSFKRPTYDFSVRILDRVAQETGYHFVFSPLSTWMQLMILAEGARGPTQEEIWRVTRHHRMRCFRRKFKEVLNAMDEELGFMTKRSNVIIVNKLLDVKSTYKNEIKKLNTTKILTLNFNDPVNAAAKANEAIGMGVKGIIADSVDAEDFNMTVLLMTDTAYFKGSWKTPFNPVYTSTEKFYSEIEDGVVIGKVRMMSQSGYFNTANLPSIKAKVLELPFNTRDRVSMFLFLPTEGSIRDLFYKLKDIRLVTIYSLLNRKISKLVTVKLPRFKVVVDVENIPELVHDMGIRRIFYPDLADLGGISDYKLYASLMRQRADIEITENGVDVSAGPEFLVKKNGGAIDFILDRPFAYLIVDKKTDVILFAGMYTKPTVF